ncbi:MAG: hypothetical protein QM636_22380 [Rhizobium sp.]
MAGEIAGHLGVSLPVIFLGNSLMYIAIGMTAPRAGRAFRAFGTRRVMAAGALLTGLGLCVIAVAPTATMYLCGWNVVGVAGAVFLTTSAFAYIVEYFGDNARSLIGTLMLASGLAGSIFLPATAFLDHWVGRRNTVPVYAAMMAFLVCPSFISLCHPHGICYLLRLWAGATNRAGQSSSSSSFRLHRTAL